MSCASGAHSTRSVGPASTMRTTSMTITRSHIARTTLRLWETSCGRKETAHAQLLREVLPQVKHHGLNRHVGDHEVGARAMPTRAFWPPESRCGKRSNTR